MKVKIQNTIGRLLMVLMVFLIAATDVCAIKIYIYENRDKVYLNKDIFTWCWHENESFYRDQDDNIVYNADEWGGLVAIFSSTQDWSDYSKVVIEFAEPTKTYVQIYMDTGVPGEDTTQGTEAGATRVEMDLTKSDWWSRVNALVLQPAEKTTLKISGIYLVKKTFTLNNLKYHVLKGMDASQVNTSLVKTERDAWGGWWEPDEGVAPLVQTDDGRTVKLIEQYREDVEHIGVIMQQEINNLPNGEYEVKLYANSCFTEGRGFSSSMRDNATDVAYVFANGVKKYITCKIASDFSSSHEYTLKVKVGTGRLRIGIGKDKAGTNWHTIQIKSLKLLSTGSPSVELVGHTNPSGTLTVPAQVKNGGITYDVTRLGRNCLEDCWNVGTVNISEGIEEIDSYAFCWGNYTTFNLPSTLWTIGDELFNANEKNTTINVSANNEWLCSEDGVLFSKDKHILYRYPQGKTGASYEIPSTVEILAVSAFDSNQNLQAVTLPEGFREQWWGPFLSCKNLKTVVSKAMTPHEFGDDLFDEVTYNSGTLYVPEGRVSTYKAINPWKRFKTIRENSGEITVTAKSYTITYGDDLPTFGWDATDKNALTGKPEIKCSATKKSKVGTYDILISQGSLVSPSPLIFVKGTLTIKKAPLAITAKSYTKKQGDAMPTLDVNYNGFKNSETKSVLKKQPTVSCKATATSAPGTYDITVSGAEADNYDITYHNGKLTVVSADAIIVTAKSYTITYGEAIPTLQYTTSGGTLKGTPTITCSAGKAGDHPGAGTYDIVVAKGTVSNYNVSYVKGTLTVKKAPLQVSAISYTKYEGEEMPTLNVRYSGFKNNDTSSKLTKKPTVECEATKWSPAGTYIIKVSGAESPNYTFSYTNGTLTVKHVYSLNITSQGNGAVTYDGTRVTNYQHFDVKEDHSVTLTFAANEGCELNQLTANGRDVKSKVSNNAYVLGKLTGDMNIVATFSEVTGGFMVNNIHFSILSAPDKTVIVDKASTNLQIGTVPATVAYDGKTWSVVGVADHAFSSCTELVSIELPQGMQSKNMGQSIFTGCSSLAAIVWNPDFGLTDAIMGVVENPNLLVYVTRSGYAPSSVVNRVINDRADKIVLSDASGRGGNFYAPRAFTATTISYSHNYTMQTGYNSVAGWETIALPFTVQKIEHASAGTLVPFGSYNASDPSQRPFWLFGYGSIGFSAVTTIQANRPFLIAMPNNTEYDSEYRLSGLVTFSAQNAQVPATTSIITDKRGSKTFVPHFWSTGTRSDAYVMNVSNDVHSETGGYVAGSTFVRGLREMGPFEAYMTHGSGARQTLDIEFSETTGLLDLQAGKEGVLRVWSTGGLLLIETNNRAEFEKKMKQLPAGVYIVNGKKIIK